MIIINNYSIRKRIAIFKKKKKLFNKFGNQKGYIKSEFVAVEIIQQ